MDSLTLLVFTELSPIWSMKAVFSKNSLSTPKKTSPAGTFPKAGEPVSRSVNYRENLPLLIQETCIAEFIHSAEGIAGFYCVSIWPGIGGFVLGMLFMLGNLPFICIQRYNRPRMLKIWKRYCTEIEEMENENTYAHADTEL